MNRLIFPTKLQYLIYHIIRIFKKVNFISLLSTKKLFVNVSLEEMEKWNVILGDFRIFLEIIHILGGVATMLHGDKILEHF